MKKGFTLIELIIVVMIIVILAGIALPQFSKTKEHALGKEAIANLKLIAVAERIYRIETDSYKPESSISGINSDLRLSIPSGSTRNWDYSVTCTGTPPSTFTVYADRVDTAPSPYKDCRYTLAHDDTDGEPYPNTSCP